MKVENQFTTESKGVWICDAYHKDYPKHVIIVEVLESGYKARVSDSYFGVSDVQEFRHDQLTTEII